MTQTKTVWQVGSFTNDRKQLFHIMKNKFKNHNFCLEASELQLLQIWKTAPYQDTRPQLAKCTSNRRAAQKADAVDDRELSDNLL